jgi:hypothetical protein
MRAIVMIGNRLVCVVVQVQTATQIATSFQRPNHSGENIDRQAAMTTKRFILARFSLPNCF